MKKASLFSLLFILCTSSYAVSAFPGIVTFSQNDGLTFQGNLKGDEWFNYISLPNDYFAVYNKESKNYEYALVKEGKLRPSGIKVDEKLHKTDPNELRKRIPLIDLNLISQIRADARKNRRQRLLEKEHNKSGSRDKVLKTKSTQWKEILKEKDPLK